MVKLPDQKIISTEWAAGFFEGEGHVKVCHKGPRKWFVIEIAQVHREPLDAFRELFRFGKVYGPYGPYATNKQAYYQFSAYGEDAKEICYQLLPFLFNKGKQIEEALAEHEEYLNVRQAA